MSVVTKRDTPFPLKRYYLVYGCGGSVVFYMLLLMLFMQAERKALYEEYIHSVSEKARSLYLDIERDFLQPQGISIEQVDSAGVKIREGLRREVEGIFATDFSLAKLKLFRADAMTLYDHSDPGNEGGLYAARNEIGFTSALQGKVKNDIEVGSDGRRLMEAYLPIKLKGTDDVVAVLEIYEDVSRFERQVQVAMKEALILPTIVFIVFNIVMFLIVSKADRIIAEKTNLLVAIRRNMEKYLSQSAVTAICHAVSESRELFHGERQALIILFSDIRSFTSYSETTEPEEVVQTLNTIFQIQAEIIHKYGGVIDKFIGDEVMVTFAAGQENEAVCAAIDILQAIDSHPDVEMTVGIGIHCGEALVGSIGTVDRRDYTVIGDTINLGARICAACPPDSTYVSDTVFEALPMEMHSHFSTHESLNLKGKAEPIGVHLFTLGQAGQGEWQNNAVQG